MVNWAVTLRAQPPAFPDIYGGELALVSMALLQSLDSRIQLQDVIGALVPANVFAIAVVGQVTQEAIDVSNDHKVNLIELPDDASLTSIERAINRLIVNQSSQLTQRAVDIQRRLTRLAAENKGLSQLVQVISQATGKAIYVHDDAGVIKASVASSTSWRNAQGLIDQLPYDEFQTWLRDVAPTQQGQVLQSPIGFTTTLSVEKRTAGYLTLITDEAVLDEFDRLVLLYGADVCAIELAKSRAIASAVEQARGDWVQMWLSGNPIDNTLLRTRATQAGFEPNEPYVAVVFQAVDDNNQTIPLESLTRYARDLSERLQVGAAIGQYVDAIVLLLPIEEDHQLVRVQQTIEELRQQLLVRTPGTHVIAGMSHAATDLSQLRDAYREARDAVRIAIELDDRDTTILYGDLKLYQLLLTLKEGNLDSLQQFYIETLQPLVEHDERKHSDLILTLTGFFEANGNLAKAAQELDVHRNTLVYRLDRISDLTSLDLNDADNRLILHLALKIQRVLATMPGIDTVAAVYN